MKYISSYVPASMKTLPFRYFTHKQHCLVCSWCSFTSCHPHSVNQSLNLQFVKNLYTGPYFSCPIRLQHLRGAAVSEQSDEIFAVQLQHQLPCTGFSWRALSMAAPPIIFCIPLKCPPHTQSAALAPLVVLSLTSARGMATSEESKPCPSVISELKRAINHSAF